MKNIKDNIVNLVMLCKKNNDKIQRFISENIEDVEEVKKEFKHARVKMFDFLQGLPTGIKFPFEYYKQTEIVNNWIGVKLNINDDDECYVIGQLYYFILAKGVSEYLF